MKNLWNNPFFLRGGGGMLFVTSNDKRLYGYSLNVIERQITSQRARKLSPDPRTLVPNPNLELE